MKFCKILCIVIPICVLLGCHENKSNELIQGGMAFQIDSLPGNCPYLTKDNQGNPVMSWARTVNDSVSVFCYAVSLDSGKTFEKPITIPSSDNLYPHSENLPKVIFKPSGEIIALWGAANPNPNNNYSGLVYYSQSFDKGESWSRSRPLVDDTASYDQRYYDVALMPDGEAAIIWLDNRKTSGKEGSSLYFAITEKGDGFKNGRMISQNCCQCCRTDLFIDSKAGIHVLYRGIIKDSIRDMLHSVSTDGGRSFSDPQLISNDNWVINGCPHTGPAMTENQHGLHFAWFTGGRNKGCFYTQSADNGNSFHSPDRISELGSHPQIASDSDGGLLIAWDEAVQADNNFNKRIAIQQRNAGGDVKSQAFITADSLLATFPVVANVKDHVSLVAYTVKRAGRFYIELQRITL